MSSTFRLSSIVFGDARFEEQDEFRAFQFRFLCAVLLSGALSTLLFVAGGMSGSNPMDPVHLRMMVVFSTATLGLWGWLRGRPDRFRRTAWCYLLLCMVEFTSAVVNVSADELRILWFFINVPGVYLLLGQRAGFAVTLVTCVGWMVGNSYLMRPYTPNALMTGVVALAYLALFFHLYTARSISYFKRMRDYNARLVTMASVDPLTGVLNARAYYEACDRWLLSAQRTGAPCAVLFIDLDHFKRINDTLGHAAGDTVLKAVAVALGAGVRRSDVLGRIGGEEFSIFLPDTTPEHAQALAEKLRQLIEALRPPIEGRLCDVTASIGVAAREGVDDDMARIQQRADQAMYRAKALGRNRVSRLDEATVLT